MVEVSKPRPPVAHTDGPEHRRQIVTTLGNVMDGLGDLSGLDEVGTDQIADAAVTTPKIADGAVTSAKLGFTPTKGNLLVGDGTDWVELGVGTDEQVLTADAAEVTGVKWADASGGIERGTAQTATGTSVDFTSIPAGVSRITVMVHELSADITGGFLFRVGTSAGLVMSGYSSIFGQMGLDGAVYTTSTTSFLETVSVSRLLTGRLTLVRIDGNTWEMDYKGALETLVNIRLGSGWITLPGELDRVSVSSESGNFDNGTVNIFWE